MHSLPNGGQDALGTKWGAGDIMYRDLNGDGKITSGATLNDPGDRKIIGNSSPRFKFGLDLNASWKGFDARLFFQGVAKRDAWLGDNMFWGATGDIWQSACFTPHLDFFREGDDFGVLIQMLISPGRCLSIMLKTNRRRLVICKMPLMYG